MKLHDRPETDSLYIDLSGASSAATREIARGFNADFDGAGSLVGLDIDHVSTKLGLSKIGTVALPPARAAA